ncbi:hypothetical protein PFISCL1PPCAC_21291, partial [Pristionchus fissidentatus]
PLPMTSSTSSCLKLCDRSSQLHPTLHPSTRSSQSSSGSRGRRREDSEEINCTPFSVHPLDTISRPREVMAEDENTLHKL